MEKTGHTPLPYKIEDVAAMLNIHRRNGKCPICGGRTSFGISVEKQTCHCMKCNFSGNATSLYAAVNGISQRMPIKNW